MTGRERMIMIANRRNGTSARLGSINGNEMENLTTAECINLIGNYAYVYITRGSWPEYPKWKRINLNKVSDNQDIKIVSIEEKKIEFNG